jgi:hypothetical protein
MRGSQQRKLASVRGSSAEKKVKRLLRFTESKRQISPSQNLSALSTDDD